MDKLWNAFHTGDLKVIKELFNENPDCIFGTEFDLPGGRGYLHLAAYQGYLDICKYLVEIGLDINFYAPKNGYLTPIGDAAREGHIEIVKFLINCGAKVNGDSRSGVSPLILSVLGDYVEITKLLIDSGADVNRLHNRWNITALDIAIDKENQGMINLLRENKGVSIYEDFIEASSERAGGLISDMHKNVGRVLPVKLTQLVDSYSVDFRTALIREKNKKKQIFTVGLFEKKPQIEVALYLREDFPFNEDSFKDNYDLSFPARILIKVAKYHFKDNGLFDGFVFEKNDSRWCHLNWPEDIDGLALVDHPLFFEPEDLADVEDDDLVTILSLIPFKSPKNGIPKGEKFGLWIEKLKNYSFNRMTIKI